MKSYPVNQHSLQDRKDVQNSEHKTKNIIYSGEQLRSWHSNQSGAMQMKAESKARHEAGSQVTLTKRDMENLDQMFPELTNRSKKMRLAIQLAKQFVDQNSDRINIVVL